MCLRLFGLLFNLWKRFCVWFTAVESEKPLTKHRKFYACFCWFQRSRGQKKFHNWSRHKREAKKGNKFFFVGGKNSLKRNNSKGLSKVYRNWVQICWDVVSPGRDQTTMCQTSQRWTLIHLIYSLSVADPCSIKRKTPPLIQDRFHVLTVFRLT